MALDGADGAVNVGHCLVLGRLPDEDFTVLGEGHDGRGGAGSLCVGDNLCFSAFQDGDAGVGGAEVNTYCASHDVYLHMLCSFVRSFHALLSGTHSSMTYPLSVRNSN